MDILSLKNEIIDKYLENKQIYEDTSLAIFSNPELGLKEKFAAKVLVNLLKCNGFQVESGIEEFDTAFIATYSNGNGKTIGFLAEYDALPGLGHGCGHNIIGTSSVAASILLKNIMEKYKILGSIKVIGTPAEENFGAKVNLINYGVFNGIDYAMMLHPADASMCQDISFACSRIEYTFSGVSAHSAAAPWDGKSALNGVIQLFNASNSMRLHLKDNCRIHGIITEGGTVDNIIPESATAIFNIRALTNEYLEHIVKMMEDCAKSSALATGTTVEIKQVGNLYKEVKNSKYLEMIFKSNFEFIGEDVIARDINQGIGSTDMGNVTHILPGIHAYIKLSENAVTHTKEFAKLSGGEKGRVALQKSSIVLAMSGLDLLFDS